MERSLAIRALPLAVALVLALAASSPSTSRAADAQPAPDPQEIEKLARSSLEDLMQIKVTTVAGVPQSRMATPAAVYVISSDDLRRSGARTIVEALRLVPGMYVGRMNSSSWVAGSRGLTGSSLTSTRYLVLVDGRQVYDPLTAVTNWDTVVLLLEDVEALLDGDDATGVGDGEGVAFDVELGARFVGGVDTGRAVICDREKWATEGVEVDDGRCVRGQIERTRPPRKRITPAWDIPPRGLHGAEAVGQYACLVVASRARRSRKEQTETLSVRRWCDAEQRSQVDG